MLIPAFSDGWIVSCLKFIALYQDDFLDRKLEMRIASNSLRKLKFSEGLIDFCSNDYLGIVRADLLRNELKHELKTGSTGSRLLAGHYPLIETVEKEISTFHDAEAALIFNSGYDANIGLLSCVPQRGDTILYDYLSHASLRDGIRLSFAESVSFTHNDLNDLEEKLKKAKGNIFIVTESVFSMDGDVCPLTEFVLLAEKYKAHLIVDEAHAIGVIGSKGEGLCQSLSVHHKIFARIYTFGKGPGCHGAVITGSEKLRNYLINFARSFVYSTALPEHAVAAIQASYRVFPGMTEERKKLEDLIELFNAPAIQHEKISSATPIQSVLVPGNEAVRQLALNIQTAGFDVRPILYPTVPLGTERIRIVLHAFNTPEQVHRLTSLL